MTGPDLAGYLHAEQRRAAEMHRVAFGSFLLGLALGSVIAALFALVVIR